MSEPLVDFSNLVNNINQAKEANNRAREALYSTLDGDGLMLDYVCEDNLVHIIISGRGIEVLEFADGLYESFNNDMQQVVTYVTLNAHAALQQFLELRALDIRLAMSGDT